MYDSRDNVLKSPENSLLCDYGGKKITRKPGKRKKMYSDYIGVTYNKTHSKYQACITHCRKQHYLGRYKLAVDAAKAYDDSAKLLKGEDWKINFSSEEEFKRAKRKEAQMLELQNNETHSTRISFKNSRTGKLSPELTPYSEGRNILSPLSETNRMNIEGSGSLVPRVVNSDRRFKQNTPRLCTTVITPTSEPREFKRRKTDANSDSPLTGDTIVRMSSLSTDNTGAENDKENDPNSPTNSTSREAFPEHRLPSILSKSIMRKLQKAVVDAKKCSRPNGSKQKSGASSTTGSIRNRTLEAVSALMTLTGEKSQDD